MNFPKIYLLALCVTALPAYAEPTDAQRAPETHPVFAVSTDATTRIARGVNEIVKLQADLGIDVVADGEMSKSGFFTYIEERMNGFEARKDEKFKMFEAEIEAFPEYYEDYFARAMSGGTVVPMHPM